MSDSSDDNLSDLEQDNAAEAGNGSGEDEEKADLKGILDDVAETEVSWKDLVSLKFSLPETRVTVISSQGLIDVLCEACEDLKWKAPSKIQREAIPVALKGNDIIGLAETGSG